MPTTRCYNCGLPGHQTQVCPRYGPRFPEPGKTINDYAEEQQRIMDLVALDVITEHYGLSEEQGEVELSPESRKHGIRPGTEHRRAVRTVACPTCGSEPGHTCRSAHGKRVSDNHKARETAYLVLNEDLPDIQDELRLGSV